VGADEAGHHPGVKIIAAAWAIADDERDPLAAIEIRDGLGKGRSGQCQQGGDDEDGVADALAIHESPFSYGDGRKPAL
jgi:hypothetical protein